MPVFGLAGRTEIGVEEGYFLGAVYCAEGSLEAQGMIKLNG